MPIYKDLWAWAFALSITGYPLIAVASAFTQNDDLSAAFRAGVMALSALCFIITDRERGFRFGSIWLLVFACLYLAKLWLDIEYDIDGASDAMLYALITALAPAILLSSATPRWFEANAALAIFIISAIAVVGILWLEYSGAAAISRDPSDRIQLDKLNPISVGHTAVTALIASYVLLQHVTRKFARLGIFVIAAAAFYLVYLAAARGPVMSLVACILLFQVLRPNSMTPVWGILLCISGFLFLALVDITPLLAKFNLATMEGNRSALARLDSVYLSWELFTENPWFGYGTQLPIFHYPHNLFMEVLQAMGVVGMAIFCGLLAQMYSATKFFAELRLPLLPLLTTQFFVGAQFSGSIYGNGSLWIVASVMIFRANAIKSRSAMRQSYRFANGYPAGTAR